MLKLAVVHAPSGPQQGPGLDDNIQSPGLEHEHMYSGPEKYEMWDPYGGTGEDNKQGMPKPRSRAPRKKASAARVAIDYDGTLTRDPKFFRKLVEAIRASGGKCYLITGRSNNERGEVERFIKNHRINFDGLYFYPVSYRYDWVGWDALLEARIGTWKAKVLAEIGAGVIIDDNPIYITQIVAALPNILVLKPVGGD